MAQAYPPQRGICKRANKDNATANSLRFAPDSTRQRIIQIHLVLVLPCCNRGFLAGERLLPLDLGSGHCAYAPAKDAPGSAADRQTARLSADA